MAFSFGFFNSKNLDRTYTAENFNDYLGSINGAERKKRLTAAGYNYNEVQKKVNQMI